MCFFTLLSCLLLQCICRNTAGRLMKRKKNPSDRSVGRAIVDQMALFRRAPGPSFVPRS
ncbi:unnamed protein product [Schistosoma bovis]|uniref:Uncharacterized protein n=1 Tax=Schistosoma mattheei TaxID=31246 RepID=A0AA85B9U0_9TREM|nr:unnamed protein product [Schistosoma mattheei]CAH8457683.1 unnamed protein product [Schistosoma curassoni]CAH8459171.1 unnamed protein product [Schistosoma haematobium]CAH8465573.1 unnamed protein product [Schistosoma bovis]CAH8466524.1 unnamed protein product [Schistosoma bovis]